MTQEIKIDLQLHLEVDTSLTKEEIEGQLNSVFEESFGENLISTSIYDIQEEAEIYGTEE